MAGLGGDRRRRRLQGAHMPDPPPESLEGLPEKEAKTQESSRTHPGSLVSGEAGGRLSFLHTAWP